MRALFAAGVALAAALAVALPTAADEPAKGWVRITAGKAFTFEAPPDTVSVPVQGIDSFVGQYRSASFELDFDYGPYSNDLSGYREDARFVSETETIDGKHAVIVTGPNSDPQCSHYTGVYVLLSQQGWNKTALMMEGCAFKPSGIDDLHRLFRSLHFLRTQY